MTVYSNFADKAALFEAVVVSHSKRFEGVFVGLDPSGGTIDVVLTTLGNRFLTCLMSDEIMQADRMLSAVLNENPGLGRRFYEVGPRRMWAAVAAIIEAASARGELETQDALQAAEDLLAVWLGLFPIQHRFNGAQVPSQPQLAARVAHGVHVLMRTYGPGTGSSKTGRRAKTARRTPARERHS